MQPLKKYKVLVSRARLGQVGDVVTLQEHVGGFYCTTGLLEEFNANKRPNPELPGPEERES